MQHWQTLLKEAMTDPAELLDQLELNSCLLLDAQRVVKLFPLRVPRSFVAKMEKGNPSDPLLRQVLPIGAEDEKAVGFSRDPLHEQAVNPLPGLLHKYQGRVLLTLAGACAINCRYCFRRHFPYTQNKTGGQAWQAILAYIQADPSIHEVILSGGDPLSLPTKELKKLIRDLEKFYVFIRVYR